MTDLSHLLTPPENWQWGKFKNNNAQKIRYGMNYPDGATAMIVIAEGRTECIEEYFETIRDFNARGFAVAIMDWQGQGLSYRYNNDNSRHHTHDLVQDVNDFTDFIGHLPTNIPKILFAHSMGGNITLRYMADNPNIFKCAYLVAPMLGLEPKRIIKYLSKTILGMAEKLRAMDKYALGQSAWNETFANIAKYKVSSDKIRRELQPYLFKTRPDLQCGGVTFGWLAEALESIAILHEPDMCVRITTPMFIAMAGRDVVVDNDGAKLVASQLPHCETQLFKKSEHQIHRERDNIRDACMQSFYEFFENHL